ncbi:MAG: hypothetical protein R3F61_02290 [Myxococcota bacterium]
MSTLAPNLAALVDMLKRRPLGSVDELRERVSQHLRVVTRQQGRGREVDLGVARSTGQLCHQMLDRWETLDDPHRALVQAACLYFVEAGDDEEDLDAGGFDDDLQIARWVATRLADLP